MGRALPAERLGRIVYSRPVPARGLTHVSISAEDLDESARFYEEVFGMERVPTPDFGRRTIWLQFGNQTLHLFPGDPENAPLHHHFGLDVDDFEAVYRKAGEAGFRDAETFWPIYELPDGSVQIYVRDPNGNMVEVNCPDASVLDQSIVTDLRKLSDDVPQNDESRRGTLYPGLREQTLA